MSQVRGLLQPTSLAHFYTNILPTRSSAARSAVTSIRVTNLYYSVPQPFANAGSITDSTIESVLTVGNSPHHCKNPSASGRSGGSPQFINFKFRSMAHNTAQESVA